MEMLTFGEMLVLYFVVLFLTVGGVMAAVVCSLPEDWETSFEGGKKK